MQQMDLLGTFCLMVVIAGLCYIVMCFICGRDKDDD